MSGTIRFFNPPAIGAPRGFSHVAEATGPGRTLYIAGQLGVDTDNKLAGAPGDFRAQATQAFENLKAALTAAGARFAHVARITNYFVNMDHLPIFFEVRDRYVNTNAPPASTAIQVVRLAREGALFEIEAIAILPPA
ncbi:MAG TPA: RidA family protein [Pseudolabrys sp.]|nr:RidA family protein [Pseudolabrys sp.]